MNTKNQIQNPQKTTHKIKITKNGARVIYGDNVELPVSRALINRYVEYMLIAGENVLIEIVP